MGIIRGSALVIIGVIFFVGLLVCGAFLTVANSLEYENIQSELVPVVEEVVSETLVPSLANDYSNLLVLCQNTTTLNYSVGDLSANILCVDVVQGIENLTSKIINDKVKEIYYQEYDCNFLDCETENGIPFYLVSEHSKNYFSGKFYFVAFVLFLLLGVIFILTEIRSNAFILAGGLIVLASLPFSKLDWFVSIFARIDFLQFFTFMFNEAFSVFVKFLVWGVLVLGAGIIWKFFSVGFKINSFVEKFKGEKKVVKKEIVK
ncbi:hypothetical protein HN832_04875 [archaeon]|jgi:hypothetical protein|nr:hypothetical protein [archaeon]MBT4374021.1 hypothetical protein [archaeon]MBT4532117.1 hypothetical protein [archaeon]MBT7002007.1 hypothetical protein [archaeon]MBT7282718.1 hypothetical protein [archaeon]